MLTKVFAVFDSKASAYLSPFFAKTAGLALRSFEQAANAEEHNFHKYAGDYTLFELGTFNEDTAEIVMLKNHINLGLALVHIEQAPEGKN